jgi:thioredoxin reductase (NADPH)
MNQLKEAAIETDVVIVGAGPAGLFSVFELGLLDIKAHVIDILPRAGGQCSELYPEKPIYDIPGLPVCTGQELTDNLLKQIEPFHPTFHFNEMVETLVSLGTAEKPEFRLSTDAGKIFHAKVVFIAAGGGSFQSAIESVHEVIVFAVRLSDFRDKNVVIVGGGAVVVNLPRRWRHHAVRRDQFRAALHSVSAMRELVAGKIDFRQRITAVEGEDGGLASAVLGQ